MASALNLDTLRFTIKEINLYGGLFVFIIGIFGELLNIIVFTTLKTFRQTTCSFYLVTTSIANIGILIVILLRIIYDGANSDLPYTPLLCKFRFFVSQYATLISLTSICLATIDQFISMTSYRRWNRLSIARRLIALFCGLWLINSIFAFVYYDTSMNVCVITNAAYSKYSSYFQTPILFGFIPLITMSIFSLLAYFRTRTIASRQIDIVRLSRDRQLTAMTLFHVLFIVILSLPFTIFFSYTLAITIKEPIEIAYSQLVYTLTVIIYCMGHACSFYIYCCVSKRFRKQVMYVLIDIHLNRWRRQINNLNNNQVRPYRIDTANEVHRTVPIVYNDIALY